MNDLAFASISEVGRLVRERKVSPVELVQSCLERIQSTRNLGAFATPTPDVALDAARRAEAEIQKNGPKGPLHGVPIAHKDCFDTTGIPTTAGSRIFEGRVPAEDGTVVQKLAEAGAVSLGKLAMPELAFGGVGCNPWDTACSPGGSSSGSGIATAAGLCYGATGSDAGGSIRIPASMCGVVGIKATYGRVSRFGGIPHTFTMDHAGPLARSVEDAALLLEAMSGFDPRDPSSADRPVPPFAARARAGGLRGLKVAVAPSYSFVRTTPEVRAAGEAALARILALGADLVEVDLPHADQAVPALLVLLSSEFAAAFAEPWARLGPEAFGPLVRAEIETALAIPAPRFVAAQQIRRLVQEDYAKALAAADVLVTATTSNPAPLIDGPVFEVEGYPNWLENGLFYTGPGNLTGLPAVSLPVGFDGRGLPLAVQLTGKAFDEATVIRVAAALEADLGLDRHPSV